MNKSGVFPWFTVFEIPLMFVWDWITNLFRPMEKPMKVTCPCPTGTFKQIVDWVFTQIEADVASFPVIAGWVAFIQTEIDTLFASNPKLAEMESVGGSLQVVFDTVCAALRTQLAGRIVMLGVLSFVQNMIDAYLAANNL